MSELTAQKPCRYCAKDIPASAALCSGCNRFQNWRRFFNFTSSILSLLVAFISVMVVGLPPLLDALKPDRAQLTITFRSNNNDRISLIVYNTGKVAGALDSNNAELHVPTDYLPVRVPTEYGPVEDPELSEIFIKRLPYNHIDLELPHTGSENALIEPGASRHIELVAGKIEPWGWDLDTQITQKLEIEGEPDPAKRKKWLEKMDYQIETTTNVIRELVVTPIEPRVWQDDGHQDECTLQIDSIDVWEVRQTHTLSVKCRRVAELIALLPSRVHIETTNRDGIEHDAAPLLSFEHQLVTKGKAVNSSKVKLHITEKVVIEITKDLEMVLDPDTGLF